MKNKLRIIFFIAGLVLCSYPLISGLIDNHYQKKAVATYQKAISTSEDVDFEKVKESAYAYNQKLYQANSLIMGTEGIEEDYDSMLDLTGSGIMGSINIPKINLDLPIYHGTSEEVLSVGIGHVEESSLPVGGENTRSILTGHRGLANAKLFTRLDELEKGDMFFVHILNETLAYQVTEIEVIEPDDVESLKIVPEKDLVTLLTCTPYGINSHRLIVTGERTVYEEKEIETIPVEVLGAREFIFAALPVVFAGYGIFILIKTLKKRKEKELFSVFFVKKVKK